VSGDKQSFFEKFYGKDPRLKFLGNATAHVGDCTVQLETTSENPINIYALRVDQAEEAISVLETITGFKMSCEGWGL